MASAISPFSGNEVSCFFETEAKFPLVVKARWRIDFPDWARAHQKEIADVLKTYGAIVFKEFNSTKEKFFESYKAATGMEPDKYKGDTPRGELGSNIYESTAVAPRSNIPLHQEASYVGFKDMPNRIAFCCITAPNKGTGRTTIGKVSEITEDIRSSMPALWERMKKDTLTYTARYLPSDSWRTRWIRWLNPSHGTIEQQFGTEDPREVEEKCRQAGLTCRWDGGWAVVSRSGIPATIDVDGVTLFCNQIYLEKLSPKLCGGWFSYFLAKLILYPTKGQFDVQFDDGSQISISEINQLLSILKDHEVARDWQEGDLLLLNNITAMHGKTPHVGEREIQVAMSGSAQQ